MNDIYNYINIYNINIKFITYIDLNSIFNIDISNVKFYVNKINLLSFHIPYIDDIITNSYQFMSIPYKYLIYFIKIIEQHITNNNILYLLYSKLKDLNIIEQQNIHFIYNENYQFNNRTPFINYLTDLKNSNIYVPIYNNNGFLFENKYFRHVYYTNNHSKIVVNENNEYYFYKNKTNKHTPNQWIGTYLNYIKDDNNNNELINIKIEFSIKILKNIDVHNINNNDFGLKLHEPIFYNNKWLNECILDNYTKITILTKIYPKSQYVLLIFDNYYPEIEFFVKDFHIIL